MKPRVLFYIDTFSGGGAEHSLDCMLRHMDRSRCDVDLMITDRRDALPVPDGVNVIDVPAPRGWRRLWHPVCRLAFSAALRLARMTGRRVHGAELYWRVMSTAMQPLDTHYDVAIAYQQGLPTYYVAHKVDAGKRIAWINADLTTAGYRRRFSRRHYGYYDHVVTVSDRLHGIMAQSGYVDAGRLSVIYDIVDVPQIRKRAARHDVSGVYGDCDLRLCTVGRMVWQKNYPLVVETARLLVDRGIRLCWCLVGDGPEYGTIKELIASHGLAGQVIMVGAQSNPHPYMRACDIYVQTSSSEGFGLTVSEAKALCKPIVSTNFQAVYDQLRDGVTGLITEMTPEAVADAIMSIYRDPALAERLRQATRDDENRTRHTEPGKLQELIDE